MRVCSDRMGGDAEDGEQKPARQPELPKSVERRWSTYRRAVRLGICVCVMCVYKYTGDPEVIAGVAVVAKEP